MSSVTALVLSAGPALHPESKADLMRVEVAHAYAQGGQTCTRTWVWAERLMPRPDPGEELTWDHRHVWYRDVRYEKVEDDSNPDAPFL